MTYEEGLVMNNEDTHDRLHQAMHRLPCIPDHDRAEDLNSNRTGRVRAAKVHAAAKARAKRWNTSVNEDGRVRAARWNANAPARQPRVFVGVQEFIARLVGQGR
jgi:hypothetical protein